MFRFLFFCLAFCQLHSLQAQYSIKGRVRDFNLNDIEFVTVVLLKDTSQIAGTITDKKGYFLLSSIKPGYYNLRVSLIGYETLIKKINVNGNVKIDSLIVKPQEYSLDEVTVVGKKTQIKSEIDKTIFEVSETMKKQSSDIFQLLQHVPEITVDIVSRSIQVNGATNILILVNGIQRSLSYASGIAPEDIEKVELITNPSGKYVSQDIASVINIITKNNISGFSGFISSTQSPSISYGLSNGNFRLNHKKISVYIDGQNFFFDEEKHFSTRDTRILDKGFEMRYLKISNQYPFNYLSNSLNGGIDYNISSRSLIILNGSLGINSYDMNTKFNLSEFENKDLINSYNVEQSNESNTNNKMLSFYYQFNDKEKKNRLMLMTDYNRFNSDYLNNYSEFHSNITMQDNQFFDNKKDVYSINLDYEFEFNELFNVEVGTRFNNQKITYLSKYNQSSENEFIYREYRNATYLNILGSLSEQLSYQIGSFLDASFIEINDSINNKYTFLLPNIGLQYKFSKNSSIKINYGLLKESPSIAALNPYTRYNDSTKLVTGNPYLSPYYLNNFKLTYVYSKGTFFLSPSLNYINTNDYITTIGNVDTAGIYRVTYDKTANYTNVNSNINLSVNIKKWGRIKGELKFDYKIFRDSNIDKDIFSLGMLIQTSFFFKKYYFQLSITKDPDELFANSRYIKPIETMGYFQWKVSKNFSINSGVRYILPWKEELKINDTGYREYYTKNIDERLYLIFIGFRYNLTKGFQGRETDRKNYQQESDAQMRERF